MSPRLLALSLLLVLFTSVTLLFAPSPARAQAPADSQHVELVNHLEGTATTVTIRGDYAYVGLDKRVQIFDISDPANPLFVGQSAQMAVNDYSGISAIEVVGTYAYVAAGRGLRILDVSDPTAPTEIGAYERYEYSSIRDVAINGDYAYLAALDEGWFVVNVADPTAPVLVRAEETYLGVIVDVTFVDNYLYLAEAPDAPWGCDCGLHILDAANPAAPRPLSFYHTLEAAASVTVIEDRAYLAAGDLHVLDISTPTAPQELSSHYTPGFATDVVVSGERAYVADSEGGLRVLNVADSSFPVEVGFYDTPRRAIALALAGEHVYLADEEGGLVVLHYTDGGEPFISGRVADTNGQPLPDMVVSITGEDSATTNDDGVYTFNDVEPGTYTVSIAYTPYYTFTPSSRVVTVPPNATAQNFLATATSSYNVELLGQLDTSGDSIASEGRYAYLSTATGFLVIDMVNPSSPAIVGEAEFTERGAGLAVEGHYVYAASDGSIYIFDVSDPSAPAHVGIYALERQINDMAVQGGYIYLALDEAGMHVLDARDPSNVSWVTSFSTTGYTSHVAVANNRLYVDDAIHRYEGYVHIFDISAPGAPTKMGDIFTAGDLTSLAAAGNYVYLADSWADRDGWWAGVTIVDVTDPAHSFRTAIWDLPGVAYHMVATGRYLYVTTGPAGLRVLDVSYPSVPQEVGFYHTPHEATDLSVAGDHAYVIDWEHLPEGGGDRNLLILGFQQPVPTATVLTTFATNAAPRLPLALGAGMLALSAALLLHRRRR
jgi:hypothetical protein